ncbi:MAG: CPBP family intramembrane metalloprotease [Chloroflexi bacterium]|nr:CPBP family intramembrane metalloprotease [Chloroflexota bacterium]
MKNSRTIALLWVLAIAAFQITAIKPEAQAGQIIVATLVFAVLMGLYLLFAETRFTEALPQVTRGSEFGLPGFLFLIFVVLTLLAGTPNAIIVIALAAAIFWLPTALIVRHEEALTPIQAAVGLSILSIPLGVDVVLGAQPDTTSIVLRAGAFALLALLLLLTTREQKSRLSFYFISVVAFSWFTVEFGNAPALRLPFDGGQIRYMQLALIVLFLYLLTLAGRLPDLGFTFELNRKDWKEAAINLALFSVIAIPFGLITGFIKPSTTLPSIVEIAGRGMAIFCFIALPEEILFRGTIHRYLERVLRWTPRLTLLLSSIIFGAAHLDNPPNVGYYFILASIAGFFYGRTYLRTGKIVPAALVHLAVDWIWSVLFAG